MPITFQHGMSPWLQGLLGFGGGLGAGTRETKIIEAKAMADANRSQAQAFGNTFSDVFGQLNANQRQQMQGQQWQQMQDQRLQAQMQQQKQAQEEAKQQWLRENYLKEDYAPRAKREIAAINDSVLEMMNDPSFSPEEIEVGIARAQERMRRVRKTTVPDTDRINTWDEDIAAGMVIPNENGSFRQRRFRDGKPIWEYEEGPTGQRAGAAEKPFISFEKYFDAYLKAQPEDPAKDLLGEGLSPEAYDTMARAAYGNWQAMLRGEPSSSEREEMIRQFAALKAAQGAAALGAPGVAGAGAAPVMPQRGAGAPSQGFTELQPGMYGGLIPQGAEPLVPPYGGPPPKTVQAAAEAVGAPVGQAPESAGAVAVPETPENVEAVEKLAQIEQEQGSRDPGGWSAEAIKEAKPAARTMLRAFKDAYGNVANVPPKYQQRVEQLRRILER